MTSAGGPVGEARATVEIVNKKGLHARAAARFAQLVGEFDVEVAVTADGETVGGDSIMGLLMLGAAQGAKLDIAATGPDAEAALDALTHLIANRFDEEDG